jgi:hypothetical protein
VNFEKVLQGIVVKKALIYTLFIVFTFGGAVSIHGMITLNRTTTLRRALRIPPKTHSTLPVQPTVSSWTWRQFLFGPNKTKYQVLEETQSFLEQFKKGNPEAVESFSKFLKKNNQEEVNILLDKLVFSENGFSALCEYSDLKANIKELWGNPTIIKKIVSWTKTSGFNHLDTSQQKELLRLLNQSPPETSTILGNIFRIIGEEIMKHLKSPQPKQDTKPINKK